MKKNIFTREYWPNEWKDGVIKTSNSMGVMSTRLTLIIEEFINFAKHAKHPLIDIGASYGVATYPALENGANVISCDLAMEQLEILERGVPEEYRSKLTILNKRFPNELNFKNNSISGILLSQVLHFLKGDEIDAGLNKCYQWLDVGGKIFITAITPITQFTIIGIIVNCVIGLLHHIQP